MIFARIIFFLGVITLAFFPRPSQLWESLWWSTSGDQQLLSADGTPFEANPFLCLHIPSQFSFQRRAIGVDKMKSSHFYFSSHKLEFSPLFFIQKQKTFSQANPKLQSQWSQKMKQCLAKLSSLDRPQNGIGQFEIRTSLPMTPIIVKDIFQDLIDCPQLTELFLERIYALLPQASKMSSTRDLATKNNTNLSEIRARQDSHIYLKTPLAEVERCRCQHSKKCLLQLERGGRDCPSHSIKEKVIYSINDFLRSPHDGLESFLDDLCASKTAKNSKDSVMALRCERFERAPMLSEAMWNLLQFPSCYQDHYDYFL